MKVLNTLVWTSMSVATLGAMGCYRSENERTRQEPAEAPQPALPMAQQPQDVQEQPQYVVVQQAPPPVIVESRPAPPSSADVWIDGYWNWDNQRYNWQAGRYEVPPHSDVVWVAPRYDAGAHRYTPGQWSKSNQNQPQQKNQAPDQHQNQDQHPDQSNDRRQDGK